MRNLPNVHPHNSNEWSPTCAACPVEQPPNTVAVTLDSEIVESMSEHLDPDVSLTAEPGTPPPTE